LFELSKSSLAAQLVSSSIDLLIVAQRLPNLYSNIHMLALQKHSFSCVCPAV
jgi:hypothetical protein